MDHDYETKGRVVAKVLRELLRTKRFETLADLSDVLKDRLADLKIITTPDDLTAAFAMLASNTEIVAQDARLEPVRQHRGLIPDAPEFNKSEAAQIYRQLLARHKREQPREDIAGAPEHFPTLMRAN